MLYMLDTNAISDLMRENPRVSANLALLQPSDRVIVCPIVIGEIQFGIERLAPGARQEALRQKAAQLFETIQCEPVTEDVAHAYWSLKLTRQRQGLSLDENDLWIASTAIMLSAVLVTRDLDFRSISGLQLQDWTAP